MAHFSYSSDIPVLPEYLFEADIVVSISEPIDYSVVPKSDGSVRVDWDKEDNTTSSSQDPIYTEVYRSTDLETWSLVTTVQYPIIAYIDDSALLVSRVYYYKVRFVRKDINGIVINTSKYTEPIAVRIVTALGFEPRDTYSNKFFQYLMNALPGKRVYDQSEAAMFSSDKYYWQTTSQETEGFRVYANGAIVHTEPAEPTALTTKRNIDFVLTKKHTNLTGQTDSGEGSEPVYINRYLIHTFLMSYANQFMALYENYFQIVSDKFIDYSQTIGKGFKPVVSTTKAASFADLFLTFGASMGLKVPKAQKTSQGFVRYQNLLKDSYANVEDLGKLKAIYQACDDVIGITTETLFEHRKFHWFKDDREDKVYMVPEIGAPVNAYVNGSTGASNMIYTALDDRYSLFVEYETDADTQAGYLEVLGSGADNPFTYLFRAHASSGATTALALSHLFDVDPLASSLVSVSFSDGGTGNGVILGDVSPTALKRRSFRVGWEDTQQKLNNRSYTLKDVAGSLETGTDYANYSCMLAKATPNTHVPPGTGLGADELVASRDDNNDGVSYFNDSDVSITTRGAKNIVFRLALTPSRMQWVNKSILKLYIKRNTTAGYIRVHRITKTYSSVDVCWNFRTQEEITTGYYWDGSQYVSAVSDNQDYAIQEWQTAGAEGASDTTLLEEFYVPQIETDQWVSFDFTNVIKELYKYETARLDMGDDPLNVLNTGFMISLDAMDDKSLMLIAGDTDDTHKPKLDWERFAYGFYSAPSLSTRYLYTDGTTRYGRLLVLNSDREPVTYNKLVYERIRNADIKLTSDLTLVLDSVPAGLAVGDRVYGETSGAVGTVSAVGTPNIFVSVTLKQFEAAETIHKLSDTAVTAVISSISYSGNKYVRISRLPVAGFNIKVNHTGVTTTAIGAPADYPAYTEWTEAGAGIEPVFVAESSGEQNIFATQDADDSMVIYLNSSDSLSTIGDVVITYKYEYNFVFLGRTITDNEGVTSIEGCSRLGSHLYGESENDTRYKSELMLPMPSTGEFVDLSGEGYNELTGVGGATADDYSDYNLGIVCDAVSNIRRFNGKLDAFKYDPTEKDYRFGHLYHNFFRKV